MPEYKISEARQGLANLIERLDDGEAPAILTRHGKPRAVVMTFEDYESIVETLDILNDEAAMRSLRRKKKHYRDYDEARKEFS